MYNSSPFDRLKNTLDPSEDQRARILARVRERNAASRQFAGIKNALNPEEGAQVRIWNRIRERISPLRATSFLEQVRVFLTPEIDNTRLHVAFLPRLAPVTVSARPLKWVAAFAIVIVSLRISPLFFLAPQTIAQSSVFLTPTRGEVSLSLAGLSQPVETETEILESVRMSTEEGEATIILHDDGTIRLAEYTSVTLHDLTDRPEPAVPATTLTLHEGTVWVQGLLPDHIRGITVATPRGDITVHGGSVSITVEGEAATVETWDRHAVLTQSRSPDLVIVAGERLTASADDMLTINRMPESAYDSPWPAQNLQRDAVHQREIAQQQRERIAARAGILPTSRLYGVKRLAENVDVFLTFDREAAVMKRLDQATTRLDEATVLIADGQSGAVALQEYSDAVLDIASGSGDSITQFLVEQSVSEDAAHLGASLPDDDVYLVKHTVLSTSAKLPTQLINESDVEASVLADAVDSLQLAAVEGDGQAVQDRLETLAPYLEDFPGDSGIDPAVKKEVLSQLTHVAESLQNNANVQEGSGAVVLRTVSRVVRSHSPVAPPAHLTEEQIQSMVASMSHRIFTYSQPRSRWNQLQQEIVKLKGHPDEGMLLRALYQELPENGLATYVRTAIQDLREEQAGSVD